MVKKYAEQTTIEMYSVKQAAEKLKLSQAQIRLLARTGKIRAQKIVDGRDWVILKLNYKRKRKRKSK